MKPAIILLALTSIALAQAPLDPPGPPGPTMRSLDEINPRIPLNQTNTPGDATCVFKITKPGSYMLTGNVKPPAGKHAFTLDFTVERAVDLDMMGYTIDGEDAGPTASAVLCNNENIAHNFRLLHGTVRNFAGTSFLAPSMEGTMELEKINIIGGGAGVNTAGRLVMRDCSLSFTSMTQPFADGLIRAGHNSVLSGVEISGSGAVASPLISTGDHGVLEGVSLTWSFGASNPTSAVRLGPDSRVSGMTARISGGTFSGAVLANSSGFTEVSGLTQELVSVTAPSAYLGWAMISHLGDTGTHENGALARDSASGQATGIITVRNCTFTTAVGIISTACPIARYAPRIRIEGTTSAPAVLRVENSHCTIAADITLAPTSNIESSINVLNAATTISSTIRGIVGGGIGVNILNGQGTAVVGSQLSGLGDSAVTGIRIAAGVTNVLVANNRATRFAAGSALVNNQGGSTNAIATIVTTPAQLNANTNPLANIVH